MYKKKNQQSILRGENATAKGFKDVFISSLCQYAYYAYLQMDRTDLFDKYASESQTRTWHELVFGFGVLKEANGWKVSFDEYMSFREYIVEIIQGIYDYNANGAWCRTVEGILANPELKGFSDTHILLWRKLQIWSGIPEKEFNKRFHQNNWSYSLKPDTEKIAV